MTNYRCPDCGAARGDKHTEGCDVARCLVTGLQRLACLNDHDHGADEWSGRWPGEAECEEFGWWVRWTGARWVACAPDHTDAQGDLNRLIRECIWDADARRWVAP